MILNSLESNITYPSNAGAEKLVSLLTNKIQAQEDRKEREKNLQQNRLALGIRYIRILESGGHLGC